jgi:hypothetical protein
VARQMLSDLLCSPQNGLVHSVITEQKTKVSYGIRQVTGGDVFEIGPNRFQWYLVLGGA